MEDKRLSLVSAWQDPRYYASSTDPRYSGPREADYRFPPFGPDPPMSDGQQIGRMDYGRPWRYNADGSEVAMHDGAGRRMSGN